MPNQRKMDGLEENVVEHLGLFKRFFLRFNNEIFLRFFQTFSREFCYGINSNFFSQ